MKGMRTVRGNRTVKGKRTEHCKRTERSKWVARNSRAAFSLFEILITVTVVAILAALAIPSYRSIESQTLESAARRLAADLRLARSQAIAQNTQWTVRFDTTGNSYELIHTGAGTPPPLYNPSASAASPAGVYIVSLGGTNSGNGSSATIQLIGAALSNSGQSVTDVTFGPLGGTGPARSEDTVIRLVSGTGSSAQTMQLTVSWVTGQVWLARVYP